MNMNRGAIATGCAGGFSPPNIWAAQLGFLRLLPALVAATTLLLTSVRPTFGAPAGLAPEALRDIGILLQEKSSWSPIQAKLESQLVHAAKLQRGQAFAPGLQNLELDVLIGADGRILVDLSARVTPGLLSFIQQRGGVVINSFPQFDAIRARIPVGQLETVAALEEVTFIRRAVEATTNIGSVDSEGDVTHRAALARAAFGVTGTGIKVGVLSDSIDSLAQSQASGDLGTVTVLPGQAGSGTGEGTAMLEIIHDLAPGAQLFFATAFNGPASFAQNILNLRSNGCDIIVDDVSYDNESPFQDAVIAQAVNSVSAGGAWYFSAAGNAGNLDAGTSGTWEGDFVDGGAVTSPIPGTGRVHSFGALAYNTVVPGGSRRRVDLFWSDPLAASTNDYDLFVLDASGTTVLRSSITRQTGTQDPYEFVSSLNVGERIAIVRFSGVTRFLHLGTGRARLSNSTPGALFGHSAAAQSFCVAAVDAATAFPYTFAGGAANPVEPFSSDGPRRVFYNANGSAITPGNYDSSGGAVRNKPDLAAADGVTTAVPGFESFFGTSAAAPHAAAIAALLRSSTPSVSAQTFRRIVSASSLDIGAPGLDRNSGSGILMGQEVLEAAADPLWINPGQGFTSAGPAGGPFTPNSTVFTLTNGGSNSLSWTLVNTSAWLNVSSTNGSLSPGAGAGNVTATVSASASALPAGIYLDTLWFTNLNSAVGRSRSFTLLVGQPDYFTEHFEANNDLAFQTFTLTPTGDASFYEVCRQPAVAFPTDPTGGVPLSLVDDDFAQVTLSGTNTVSLYGYRTNVLFVGSNGYLTMGSGDTELDESLANHFSLRRISALFDDLAPDSGGSISWKQLADRLAISYVAVPEFGDATQTNSFQVELFFDGRIRLTYLAVSVSDGLAGLSQGQGVPANFQESNFSGYNTCLLPIEVLLPASANESDGVLAAAGQVQLPVALGTNLTLSLISSDLTEVTVPANVTIVAGQTNASFDLLIADDSELDGTQIAGITATAPGIKPATNSLAIFDNESAGLLLSSPFNVNEGAGVITGTVSASSAPAQNITVLLSSSNTNEIQLPAEIVIPAGATSAPVTLTIIDDLRIDGDQLVTLTAHIPNWTNAETNLIVIDNESTNLSLSVPSQAREGNGVLAGAGMVSISGTLLTNLVIGLLSADTNEVIVPASATILAGQTSVVFNVTIVNDSELDGMQQVFLTAAANGFATGSNSIQVTDDETPLAPLNPAPPDLAVGIAVTNDLSWSYPAGEEEELLNNGNFEIGSLNGWVTVPSGSGGFVINTGTNNPPSPDGPTPPFAGAFSALAQQTGPGLHSMFQDVVISSNASAVTLRWVDRIRNFAPLFSTNQQFRVELRNTNNGVLAVVFSTSPADPLLGGWVERSADLSSYRGQTVRIAFVVNPNLGLLDVHLDNVSVLSSSPPATTYDVYFGTNPAPGLSELVGSTTNKFWDLPTLAPLTTYYWQVVAKRSADTASPVWQFTTRGLTHFAWLPVTSPQYIGEGFGVTILAKDEFNTTVSNFTGTVNLNALSMLNSNSLLQVPITPAQSGTFADGAWAGQITVLQPATNVFLIADDQAGHTGTANTFDVQVHNDLFLSMNDSPDPVIAGQNVAYSILVFNTGPLLAEGIVLTNLLPASASLVAVGLSQGTYTNFNGAVTCQLGSLGVGSNLFVSIVLTPNLGGKMTNAATVSRAGTESYLENNSTISVTTVLPSLSISDVSLAEGLSGSTQALFLVNMVPASTESAQVSFATSNLTALAGSDYTATNGVLVFNPGETNRLISVPILGDRFYESNETFVVNLSAAVNAAISDTQAVGTIVNDDLLLPAIADQNVNEGTLLTFSISNNAAVLGTPFTITDFESFSSGTANGTVMFRDPRNSGTTLNNLSSTPNVSSVTNNFPAGNASSRVLWASWSFAVGATDPWLRFSTLNSATLPNPTVPFNQSIRFDLYTDRALKVGLGLRETSTTAAIGANGGAGGNVEFAGVPSTIGGSPVPSRTVPSNTWTTVQFDLGSEAISALVGNGILESTTGKGVLDHLALVPAGGLGTYNIYLDNFVVFSNRFVYSLEPGAPPGATIHAVSGQFSWTPTQAQGPGIYNITVRLSDTTSALFDTRSFNVTVQEVNTAPTLFAISNRVIVEGSLLSFTNTATDLDSPSNTLTFSLETNAPAGASINPTNGVFTWTPSEAQGPSTNLVSVKVTDNGVPPQSDVKSFTIVVTESNSAPVLTPITNRILHAGSTLTITNTASDPDLPTNLLTFSLPAAPPGAAIQGSSGILTWTPTDSQIGTNGFTVRVVDNGSPPLTNTTSFTAVVVPPPAILSIGLAGTNVTLVWSAVSGRSYELQFKNDLTASNWTALLPRVTATSNTAGQSDTFSTQRFYRVFVLP